MNIQRPYTSLIGLLGGPKVVKDAVESEEQAHEVIERGLPTRALLELIAHLKVLDRKEVLNVIGVSERAFVRRSKNSGRTLSIRESGTLWQLAAVITQATAVFGEQTAAERWLDGSALALNHKRPIDLLRTPPGRNLVCNLLTRLEYGVYA